MSGLSAAGFERKRLTEIKTGIENRLKLVFGENIDFFDDEIGGNTGDEDRTGNGQVDGKW